MEQRHGKEMKLKEGRHENKKMGSMLKSVSLRVRKCYFDQIVKGDKKVELRKLIDWWSKRLHGAQIAVFVCGKRVHRRKILCVAFEDPEAILGRPLSEQGKKDVPGDRCFAIWLGEEE